MSILFKHLPTIVAILAFIITINILLKKGDNGYYSSIRKFEEDEMEANSTTKNIKTINLNYIVPKIASLPFKEYKNDNNKDNKLISLQNRVRKKASLEMIKIPLDMSNTKLKKTYGINNFKYISKLEEHYNSYVRSLYDWANELFTRGSFDECEKVLLEAIRIEGDISDIYILLSNIYISKNDKISLIALRDNIIQYELSLKDKIIKNIENGINR